jgi:hypothetical protein
VANEILLSSGNGNRKDVWNASLLQGAKYDGKWEMPIVPACHIEPTNLTAFTRAKRNLSDNSFLHFYQDDYKFERVWRNPKQYLDLLKSYGGAISPDFSVYREMPLSQQLESVYKNRVLNFWWSKNGIPVIPNVRWGDKRTYEFCFDGLPQNSVLAVGTYGSVKHVCDRNCFMDGFFEMVDRLNPKAVVVYGSTSDKIFLPLFSWKIRIIPFESELSQIHRKAVA